MPFRGKKPERKRTPRWETDGTTEEKLRGYLEEAERLIRTQQRRIRELEEALAPFAEAIAPDGWVRKREIDRRAFEHALALLREGGWK